MADVVLVFPKSSFLEKAMKHVYLPLALLNSVVFVEKEYSVIIIDQRIDNHWKYKLLKELKKKPLCIGVTCLTGEQIEYALEISKIVKEESDIPVVWGGAHANILPEQTLQHEYIDLVIQGEGEISFYELVKALDKKTPLKDVKGLWYKDKGVIKSNPPANIVDLESLPRPPYYLLDMKNYILKFGDKKMFILETARGCPNRCTFCFVQNTPIQRRWRALSPQKTVENMIYVKEKFKVDGVEFQDLTSFVDLQRMKEIAELMIREKVDLFWNTCGRVNDVLRMDSKYIDLMEKSNLKRFGVGVESGSERILRMIKKGITIKQVLAVSKKLSKTKIEPIYSFMAGFPTETQRELRMTSNLVIRLLKENPVAKTTIIHCYRPIPGNELFNVSVKHGLKPPTTLEEWSKYTMEWINHPWLSKKMQKEISALNFLSLFLDKKYEEVDDPLVRAFAQVYKPLALYRVKNHNFNFMIEPYFKKIYVSLKK